MDIHINSMIVDIAETRDNLIKHINDLTMNYSQLLHDRTNIETNKNTEILLLNNQNCLQLQEIQTLNENISELNKKCYDYEQIINEYQSKMVDMEKDKKCENKVSIMRVQADELHKKDQYIDQLQQKIKFLQGDKKNISLKFIDKNDENLFDKNHDEFMQTESEPSPYSSLDGQIDGQIDETEGWSPTTSRTPVPVLDKVILDVVVEDMDTEGDSDCIDIEYKRIKYKGEKYYIVVGEEPQVVYRHMEDGDVGSKVGIRKKKTKGKGYDINFD